MICRILSINNNLVVPIPQEMLDRLHVGEGDEVFVELNTIGNSIAIAPVQPVADSVDAEFARQVAEFTDAYRPALAALAR